MKLIRSISKKFSKRKSTSEKDTVSLTDSTNSESNASSCSDEKRTLAQRVASSRKSTKSMRNIKADEGDKLDDIGTMVMDLAVDSLVGAGNILEAFADFLNNAGDSLQNDERWIEMKHELQIMINGESVEGEAQNKATPEAGDEDNMMNRIMALLRQLTGEEEVERVHVDSTESADPEQPTFSDGVEGVVTTKEQEECIGSVPIEVQASAVGGGMTLQSAPLMWESSVGAVIWSVICTCEWVEYV